MSDPFVAEIRLFAGNFAPKGWAFCDGQLLPINQNTALFSLLGTTYGGNGQTNFALPNFRDRIPMHPGQGPGLTARYLGEVGGATTHTLTTAELPSHSHLVASSFAATSGLAQDGLPLAVTNATVAPYGPAQNLAPMASAQAGGGAPHENRQPYLALSFIIALQGIFPSRT